MVECVRPRPRHPYGQGNLGPLVREQSGGCTFAIFVNQVKKITARGSCWSYDMVCTLVLQLQLQHRSAMRRAFGTPDDLSSADVVRCILFIWHWHRVLRYSSRNE